jgi:serine/threonine-protein kinase RsbW
MEVAFTITLPREAASVPVVRRLCRCSFRSLGVEEECLADLELAVTEACTNVLQHAAGTGDRYNVEIWANGETCNLRVKDAGAGFDPDGVALTSSPPPGAESGRGIQLMRVLVDNLHFDSGGSSGTVVHLRKSLELRDDSLLAGVGENTGRGPRRPYTR